MSKGRPFWCKISIENESSFRVVRNTCKKHNLYCYSSPGDDKTLYIRLSRKHQNLINSLKKGDGIRIEKLEHLPEKKMSGERAAKKTSSGKRKYSKGQKNILRALSTDSPREQDYAETELCGIPLNEIREYALFLSKGEFLKLAGLTSKEFNEAVLSMNGEINPDIYFTYTCPNKDCGHVYQGSDALSLYRAHLVSTKHTKNQN